MEVITHDTSGSPITHRLQDVTESIRPFEEVNQGPLVFNVYGGVHDEELLWTATWYCEEDKTWIAGTFPIPSTYLAYDDIDSTIMSKYRIRVIELVQPST